MSKRLKFEWHKAVSAAELPDITKLLAFAVWDFTDQHGGNAHPGNELLAQTTGRSIVTIKRHLSTLRENGWLVRVEESNSRGNRRFADVYQLAIPNRSGVSQEIPDAEADRVSPDPDRVSQKTDRVSPRRSPIKHLTTISKQERGTRPQRLASEPAARDTFGDQSSTVLSGW